MAKQKNIGIRDNSTFQELGEGIAENGSRLPQGPWLSEDEFQTIMHIDADAEFDRIMEEKERMVSSRRHKSVIHLLWPVGVAAAIVVAVMMNTPQPSPQGGNPTPTLPTMEGDLLSPLTAEATTAEASPFQDDMSERAASASPSATTHASVWGKTNNTSCAGTRLNPNSQSGVDPSVSDILQEADLAFAHADRVCEGMIVAADCEFEPEEENDASVIYI